MAAPRPIHDLLHKVHAKELIPKKDAPVLALKPTDTIENAINVLAKNAVQAAAVMNAEGKMLGFVDTLDILKHIADALPTDAELKRDEMHTLQIAGRAFGLITLDRTIDLSGRDYMVQMFEDDPATHALDVFASGVHRIALFNKQRQITGILSQSDVNTYLAEKIKMGDSKLVAQRSIAALGYAKVPVESISKNAKVIQALRKMAKLKLSALAVVNEEGRLVGNFSASDVQGLFREKFPHLLDSVEEYLTKHSPKSLQPICTLATNSLQQVVADLAEGHLHHLWVVDDFYPVGIVSLTDVMRICATAQL